MKVIQSECYEQQNRKRDKLPTNALRGLDEEDSSALTARFRFGYEHWFLVFVLELKGSELFELVGEEPRAREEVVVFRESLTHLRKVLSEVVLLA